MTLPEVQPIPPVVFGEGRIGGELTGEDASIERALDDRTQVFLVAKGEHILGIEHHVQPELYGGAVWPFSEDAGTLVVVGAPAVPTDFAFVHQPLQMIAHLRGLLRIK